MTNFSKVLFLIIISSTFHFPANATELNSYMPVTYTFGDLDVSDLGFSEDKTKPNPELQKALELRTSMLQRHQYWGLAALGGMAATYLSGGEGELPPEHPWFAGITLGLYSVSAYYALMSPDRPEGPSYGQLRWHRWLSWIHLTGMVLTPIAGYLAAKKFEKGEKLSGLAEQHKNIAGVTAISFALSVLTVTFEF